MPRGIKRQKWGPGDLFAVPLLDGSFLLGQVLAHEPQAMNGVSCALFDQRFNNNNAPRPAIDAIFSILLVTRDLLDRGVWQIVGNSPIDVPRSAFPFENLRPAGFVGATIRGSRIVNEFANAFCGLHPWDDWANPDYLDGLLISPAKKPKHLVTKT